jgi:hypothetical protein
MTIVNNAFEVELSCGNGKKWKADTTIDKIGRKAVQNGGKLRRRYWGDNGGKKWQKWRETRG